MCIQYNLSQDCKDILTLAIIGKASALKYNLTMSVFHTNNTVLVLAVSTQETHTVIKEVTSLNSTP